MELLWVKDHGRYVVIALVIPLIMYLRAFLIAQPEVKLQSAIIIASALKIPQGKYDTPLGTHARMHEVIEDNTYIANYRGQDIANLMHAKKCMQLDT